LIKAAAIPALPSRGSGGIAALFLLIDGMKTLEDLIADLLKI